MLYTVYYFCKYCTWQSVILHSNTVDLQNLCVAFHSLVIFKASFQEGIQHFVWRWIMHMFICSVLNIFLRVKEMKADHSGRAG
jgi:hypothetical protein